MDKFGIRQLLDGDSHVGAYSKGTGPILAHQGLTHDMKAKGNADPKPRPLSSAILGPSWPRGRYFYFSASSSFSRLRRLELSLL